MDKLIRDPVWQFLATVYTIITIFSVVPPIKDFFFQDPVHILLYLLLLALPLLITPLVFKQARTSIALKAHAVFSFFTRTVPRFLRHYWRIELVLVLLAVTLILLRNNLRSPFTICLLLIYIYLLIAAYEETGKHRKPNTPWVYDFYEHYKEAVPYKMPEYEQYKPESSGHTLKRALWAQPPASGDGWYLYRVLLPKEIKRLELSFWIGIRDSIEIAFGSSIRFEIKVDDKIVFQEEYRENSWSHKQFVLQALPGSEITILFITRSTGMGLSHGALWGEPTLKGYF